MPYVQPTHTMTNQMDGFPGKLPVNLPGQRFRPLPDTRHGMNPGSVNAKTKLLKELGNSTEVNRQGPGTQAYPVEPHQPVSKNKGGQSSFIVLK